MALNEVPMEVNNLAIRVPEFMESASGAWFDIMEAQFFLRKITQEETKFYHVLAALPPNIVARLPHHVLTQKSFSLLKEEVISIFERTKPELFEKLTSSQPLSGRPSLYLQNLSQTAEKVGVSEELVRHKFIQALPASIAPVLATQKDLTLSQLGKLTDELLPLINQASCFHIPQPLSASVPQPQTNYQPPKKLLPPSVQPFHSSQKPKVCRGHIYYGQKSRTCKPWCQWPNKSNVKILQPTSRPASPNLVQSEN